MNPKRRAGFVVWARRSVQAGVFFFFLYLFWLAQPRPDGGASPLIRFFFNINPLAGGITWLTTHALIVPMLLGLVTVATALVFGRAFCGWVCPLGTVHAAATWFGKRRGARRPGADNWTVWQRSKYYLLIGLAAIAVFGGHWAGVFDPFSVLYRSFTAGVYPGVQYAAEDAATSVYVSDPHAGPLHLTSVTEPAYKFLKRTVFARDRQVFDGATLILLLFAGIVLLNLYRKRFWCRYACPLGALLGVCSQRPVMRLTSIEGRCNDCGRCATRCPSAADPDKPDGWRPTECYACWNCVAACNRGAIDFKFRSPLPAPSSARLDLGKRAMLSAGVAGLGGLLLFRLTPRAQAKIYNPALIRPPGSRPEREFLQRCLKCGLCMKACPTNGLQPAGLQAGLEGVWTPVLVPQVGYCDYACNLCGQVCPTEAIQPLPIEEKKKTNIGLAVFDRGRCLPWAYDRECMICEEHCPTSPKAIFCMPAQVVRRDGRTVTIKQPRVDAEKCIGCGICENVCVFRDQPAIRVTSANESRNTKNQAILGGVSGWKQLESAPAEQPAPASDPYGSN